MKVLNFYKDIDLYITSKYNVNIRDAWDTIV